MLVTSENYSSQLQSWIVRNSSPTLNDHGAVIDPLSSPSSRVSSHPPTIQRVNYPTQLSFLLPIWLCHRRYVASIGGHTCLVVSSYQVRPVSGSVLDAFAYHCHSANFLDNPEFVFGNDRRHFSLYIHHLRLDLLVNVNVKHNLTSLTTLAAVATITRTLHETTTHANHSLLPASPASPSSPSQPAKKDKIQVIVLWSLLRCALGAVMGLVGLDFGVPEGVRSNSTAFRE